MMLRRMVAGALSASMLRFELLGRGWQAPAERVSSVFARIVAPARLNGWTGPEFTAGVGRDLPLAEGPVMALGEPVREWELCQLADGSGQLFACAEAQVEAPASLMLVGQVVRVDAWGVEHVTAETEPRLVLRGDTFKLTAKAAV